MCLSLLVTGGDKTLSKKQSDSMAAVMLDKFFDICIGSDLV